jgi:hypothetical protein
MRTVQWVMVLACLALISACGGGGGGGGSSSSGSSSGGSARGSFTMSGTSATFSGIQGIFSANTGTQTFQINVTGPGVAAIGAAYAAGQTPAAWLGLDITGSGNSYTLHVSANPGFVGPGTHTASFTVGTADTAGSVLQTRVFTVTYNVDAALSINTSGTLNRTYNFGDASRTETVPVNVTAANRTWTASSSATWLRAPAAPQTGSGTSNVVIDITGVAPGTYSGAVTFTNSAVPSDARTMNVQIRIDPATFQVGSTQIVAGGTDGRAALAAVPVSFTLGAGTGTHPFSASLVTDSGGAWATLDRTSGTVGNAGGTINVSFNRGQLPGGTYTGQLTVSADVYGTAFVHTLPVTMNVEANRLVVSAAGVALSRVNGREVLTRHVRVNSSLGNTTTAWTATSSEPWLTVTPSGTTGGDITLTATPGSLAADTTHFATVTVASSTPLVENTQTIRVGLHLSAAAPVAVGVPEPSAAYLATSPVEPIVAVASTVVRLYDAYSGALLRTLTTAGAQPGSMVFSPDGRTLFVYDVTNRNVREIEVATGNLVRTFDSTPLPAFSHATIGRAITVIRPNGYWLLVTPSARTYDLSTGNQYSTSNVSSSNTPHAVLNSLSLSSSPDQTLLVTHYGSATRIVRTALNGGGLVVDFTAFSAGTAQGRDGEACISAAGDRMYTASGYPYNFPATSLTTNQVIQVLPGSNYPSAIQCVWNGLVLGGIDGYYDNNDIWVYHGPSGVLRGMLSSNGQQYGYRRLLERGVAVSGDGTRAFTLYSDGSYGVGSGTYFHTLPTPE